MLEIERKIYNFKIKEVWFSNYPFDIEYSDSIIFRECKENCIFEGSVKTGFTTLVIDLSQDLDMIWNNMSKSSCRYAINKSIKDGVKIKINKDYETFSEMNRSFRKKKKLEQMNISVEFMKRYGSLFISELDGEILGGQYYLHDEYNIRWLIGASRRLEVGDREARLIGNANRLIIWEAIKFAKLQGIKELNMGGYYTGDVCNTEKTKINNFKESFGAKMVTYYNYEKDYSKIFTISKKIKNLLRLKNI